MADTDVDIFIETLKNLTTSSKLSSIINEKPQLQSLEKPIEYLREFLIKTDKKRKEHSEVMNLVKRIRDVISEAEDIVELFVVRVFKANHHDQDHLPLDLESVQKEIKTLEAEVKRILDENTYGINAVAVKNFKHSTTGSSVQSNTSKGIEKKVVVGFEKQVVRVAGMLVDGGEKELEIINIIGAAGSGKTTLAKEVYDHRLISDKFDIRAWVDISQGYDPTMKRNLLIRIWESVSPGKQGSDHDVDKLGEEVHKCLKGKKYLIVMDDVWDTRAWNDIQRSFPKNMGSKVLFTSRSDKFDDLNFVPCKLERLGEDSSWELLRTKVFGPETCPSNLVDIGKQIAAKCDGLPLAIVAIAGILATEHKTVDVWNGIAKHLSSIIAKQDQEGCMEILELSYNHSPLHLQACFLYIGGFTEDSEILVRDLTWLWIGEGLIRQSEGRKSLETLAKDYLEDLIARNLVMVARTSSLGRFKACRIHDLIRELCLKKAEEGNFLVRISKDGPVSPSAHRRFFIGHEFSHSLGSYTPSLRSFLCLSLQSSSPSPSEQSLSFFTENFELLRILSSVSNSFQGEIGVG